MAMRTFMSWETPSASCSAHDAATGIGDEVGKGGDLGLFGGDLGDALARFIERETAAVERRGRRA